MAGIRESADASDAIVDYGEVVRAEFGLGSLADRAVLILHAGGQAHHELDRIAARAWDTASHLEDGFLGGTGKVFLISLAVGGREVLRLAEPDEAQEDFFTW